MIRREINTPDDFRGKNMIYLKKIPISGDIIKLIIKLRREPARYSKGFIEEIDGTDHPLMQAVGVYGFAHAIRADEAASPSP